MSTRSDQRRTAKRQRRRRIILWFVGMLAALAITVGLAAVLVVTSLSNMLANNVTTLPSAEAFPAESTRPALDESGAQNILFMGSDARGATAEVGVEEVDNQRSDVLMVVHIDADRENVHVMSILRDSWVDIPGHGFAKVNAAYAWGGTPLTVATVESLLGVRIDHVAIVGFEGFAGMTDALGGIDVNVTVPFEREGHTYMVGSNHLTGKQALGFVRERYAFVDGDYQRARNQQEFIRAMMDKALRASTLSSPEAIFRFTSTVTKHLSVDEGFTFQSMFELGVSLRNITPDDLHFSTVPTVGTGMEGDQSVVYLDDAKLLALRDAFATDSLSAPLP